MANAVERTLCFSSAIALHHRYQIERDTSEGTSSRVLGNQYVKTLSSLRPDDLDNRSVLNPKGDRMKFPPMLITMSNRHALRAFFIHLDKSRSPKLIPGGAGLRRLRMRTATASTVSFLVFQFPAPPNLRTSTQVHRFLEHQSYPSIVVSEIRFTSNLTSVCQGPTSKRTSPY